MFWLDEGLWLVSSAMLLGIQTRRVHLGLGPRLQSSTTARPLPTLPAHGPPRLPLLYSTAGPGSAVTYTAERYSYGRAGQKERQVRCPPTLRGACPLDQGGICVSTAAAANQLGPNPQSRQHGACHPSLCPSPHHRGHAPIFCLPACLGPPPARAQHRQPLLPATKLLEQARSKEPGGG